MPVSPAFHLPPAWIPAPLARRATRARARSVTPILCYHAVLADPAAHPITARNLHAITPDALHRQLSELGRVLRFVPVDELAERAADARPLTGLAAVTFDDGHASVLEAGLPVLSDLEIPATLYVTTSLLEGGILWRDKVRYVIASGGTDRFLAFARARDPRFEGIEANRLYHATKDPARLPSTVVARLVDEYLEADGVDTRSLGRGLYASAGELAGLRSPWLAVGNHSHRHLMLSTLDPDEVAEEVGEAQRRLRTMGVEESRLFAVPFGGLHTFGPSLVPVLRDLGYRGYLMISNTERSLDCRAGIERAPGGDGLIVLRRFMPRVRDPWVLL